MVGYINNRCKQVGYQRKFLPLSRQQHRHKLALKIVKLMIYQPLKSVNEPTVSQLTQWSLTLNALLIAGIVGLYIGAENLRLRLTPKS